MKCREVWTFETKILREKIHWEITNLQSSFVLHPFLFHLDFLTSLSFVSAVSHLQRFPLVTHLCLPGKILPTLTPAGDLAERQRIVPTEDNARWSSASLRGPSTCLACRSRLPCLAVPSSGGMRLLTGSGAKPAGAGASSPRRGPTPDSHLSCTIPTNWAESNAIALI